MRKSAKEPQVAPPVKRKSLKLIPADWFWLDEKAADTKSCYRGKPSWRRLVARIARGELVVSPAPKHVTNPVVSTLDDSIFASALEKYEYKPR